MLETFKRREQQLREDEGSGLESGKKKKINGRFQALTPCVEKIMFGKKTISSLTSDLKPDNWVTFYLFYFNQGHGSDSSFQLDNLIVHFFAGNLISAENSDVILNAIEKKHEFASGEFIHILTNLSDNDIEQLKSSAGAALIINSQSGEAKSMFFYNAEEIKACVMNLRTQGAKQLH